MKIDTESGYRIISDGICVTLYKKPKKEQKRWPIVGHYPRFSQAIDRLLEERIADSEADTLEKLKEAIFAVHEETKQIVEDIVFKQSRKGNDR